MSKNHYLFIATLAVVVGLCLVASIYQWMTIAGYGAGDFPWYLLLSGVYLGWELATHEHRRSADTM